MLLPQAPLSRARDRQEAPPDKVPALQPPTAPQPSLLPPLPCFSLETRLSSKSPLPRRRTLQQAPICAAYNGIACCKSFLWLLKRRQRPAGMGHAEPPFVPYGVAGLLQTWRTNQRKMAAFHSARPHTG